MAKHIETGQLGEQLAVDYLQGKGYQILAQNWRFKRAELDIIAKIEGILVFIEVKTRTDDFFGPPESAVTEKKQRLMVDAASAYMEEIGHEWEIRFDIIAILVIDVNHQEITHFEDAFFPSW